MFTSGAAVWISRGEASCDNRLTRFYAIHAFPPAEGHSFEVKELSLENLSNAKSGILLKSRVMTCEDEAALVSLGSREQFVLSAAVSKLCGVLKVRRCTDD